MENGIQVSYQFSHSSKKNPQLLQKKISSGPPEKKYEKLKKRKFRQLRVSNCDSTKTEISG
jgi:hypothetical protein